VTVGIDLVAAEEIVAALRDHGERYLRRVYTAQEVAECGGPDAPDAAQLARRFAAKEAAIKALRPAGEAVPWTDIEVCGPPERVELVLHGQAAVLAERRRLDHIAITMTTQEGLAAAIAVASS
jgi:holo-[acyl-carrier protein] synthase